MELREAAFLPPRRLIAINSAVRRSPSPDFASVVEQSTRYLVSSPLPVVFLHAAGEACALRLVQYAEPSAWFEVIIGPGHDLGAFRGELVHSAEEKKRPSKAKGGSESSKPSRSVGDALRQAYDETLHEDVPDDLLDLLKKLD